MAQMREESVDAMTRPGADADRSPLISFRLPRAVVLTGSSSGFGALLTRSLLEAGVQVVGVDIAEPAYGSDAHPGYIHVSGDVTIESTWAEFQRAMTGATEGELGLVTCAAILHVGTAVEHPLEAWRKVLDVNVTGTFLALKSVVPEILRRGGGPVVCMGSVDALFGEQQLASYCASKAGVYQLARATALDFAREGLRVNVLSPGPMSIGLFERHLESVDDPGLLQTRTARQPIGRILDPEEVARTAMFLLSNGSSAMTGTEVLVDGGLTAGYEFRPPLGGSLGV
jgi:NAD(P)-dependent dehydrogenase (short-subunit alcohol dehydrogenase family)